MRFFRCSNWSSFNMIYHCKYHHNPDCFAKQILISTISAKHYGQLKMKIQYNHRKKICHFLLNLTNDEFRNLKINSYDWLTSIQFGTTLLTTCALQLSRMGKIGNFETKTFYLKKFMCSFYVCAPVNKIFQMLDNFLSKIFGKRKNLLHKEIREAKTFSKFFETWNKNLWFSFA